MNELGLLYSFFAVSTLAILHSGKAVIPFFVFESNPFDEMLSFVHFIRCFFFPK